MKTISKNIFLSFLLMFNVLAFGQNSDSVLNNTELQTKISKLEKNINALQSTNKELKSSFDFQKKQIDSLSSQLSITNSNIQQIADSLHITVSNVSSTNLNTQTQIEDINQTITTRTLYWIIGILLVALLSIFIFIILRNKLSLNSKNIDLQISKTNQKLNDESIKLDSKLVEILQTQFNILNSERNIKGNAINENDHKLPLKVGNEIYRMRRRIESMQSDNKSIIPLSKSLERLEEVFNNNGYEIIDYLNKPFNDGYSVKATFIPSDTLKPGERIITKVIKPQINFKGQSIQMAEIEVSTGD